MKAGKMITIEGGDGAGKSTQHEVIAQVLGEHEIPFILTREPGGTPIGEALRDLLLSQNAHSIGHETELLMMFAARSEHLATVIKPALKQGTWVVSDRFADASFAYQGARGVSLARIERLSKWALKGFVPDLTLLFDLPVELGLERVNHRGEPDRFEQTSLDYKQSVQAIYRDRAAAEPDRMKLIDASGDIQSVALQVSETVRAFIRGLD